jgi:hypothetical protein
VPARPAIREITRPGHWELMVAPVRFELLEAMRSIAPCSVREIAVAIDRPADTLYPHLRQLLRIGVIVDAGERAGRTRPERVYDLVADDFRPVFRGTSKAVATRAIDRSMQTMAGMVSRASRKSAAAGRLIYTEETQNVFGNVELAWLSAEDFELLRQKLRAIKRFLDRRKDHRRGSLFLAGSFVVPVTRTRGARVAKSPTSSRRRRARQRKAKD